MESEYGTGHEAAQLAEEMGPALVDRIVGPYTGRALTPLATIDLVGWDIHRAIVDNVYANTSDEAHETNKLPGYMASLMEKGVLGDKTGSGFFKRDGKKLDPMEVLSWCFIIVVAGNETTRNGTSGGMLALQVMNVIGRDDR